MNSTLHWLLQAAQRAHPKLVVTPKLRIAPSLSDAWSQVCGLYQISATELARRVPQVTWLSLAASGALHPATAVACPSVCAAS